MRRRSYWGIGITLVYALFAAGTLGFVTFAMHRPVDLVSDDYYLQSLAHDARMAASARASALGAAFSIVADPSSERVTVTWPQDMPVEAGSVTLYRASNARADRHLPVAPDARGVQYIPTSGLERGSWSVRVDWTAGGESFFAERRLMLR